MMRNNITDRQRGIADSMAELNNIVGNLILPSTLEPGKSTNAAYAANVYTTALEDLNTVTVPRLNYAESVIAFDKKSDIEADATYLRVMASDTSAELAAIRDELAAVRKFIEYNAQEDFFLLGDDTQNDTDRITNVKEGFELTADNVQLYDVSRQQVKRAQEALAVFEKSKDLAAFHTAVQESQQTIIDGLDARVKSLMESFNRSYIDFIYQ